MTDSRKKGNASGFEPIGGVIGRVLQTCRSGADIELTRIWENWGRVVGEAVAANAQPAAFKGNLLIVHVSSSVWLQQLRFVKADMIGRANAVLGKDLVADIKFKIGPLE